MSADRRGPRILVSMYADLLFDDREPRRCFVTSLSERGLCLDALTVWALEEDTQVQLELTLPGEEEQLWIVGEIVRDTAGALFQETAIRFITMAETHRCVLRRWVRVKALALALEQRRFFRAA